MTDSVDDGSNCCAPEAGRRRTFAGATDPVGDRGEPANDPEARFIAVPAGRFLMGSNDPAAHPLDREGPVRLVSLNAFALDATAVSNRRFARFVEATGHLTEAERQGWSFVFAGFTPDTERATAAAAGAPWWRQAHGACWRRPEGHESTIQGREGHPVVHISYRDALAYCAWAGARLPSEAEWECAARGGLVQTRFPWGNDLTPGGRHRCNIWQGDFPRHNTGDDGFIGAAPVDAFDPCGLGFHNMVGNVWEWCADWFDRGPLTARDLDNPRGPNLGSARVTRGGSYLCHESYCFRYRVSARSSAPPDSTTGHIGFRIARDA